MTYLPNGFDVTLLIVMFAFFAAEVQIFARLRARDPMNSAAPRMRTYAFFIVYQWLLVACTAALWIAEKRSWAVLLLGAPNAIGFAVGLALVVVYLALALIQRRAIFARPELLERMRPHIGDVEFLAPRTPSELRAWYVAAITAGCCEEVFYRGFILAFVGHFAGIAAAAAVSCVLFGLYHAYYGWKGVVKTGSMGVILLLMALGARSLIPGILLHAAVDVFSGDTTYRVLEQGKEA